MQSALLGEPCEDRLEDALDLSDVIDVDDDVGSADRLKNTLISDTIDDADLSSPYDSLSYDSYRFNVVVYF